ncbi:MAG: hypothetical protein HY901_16595 [Deltaproteobacteria bacterium]|nr:hypothetical protein [Deltaproteobacteria bacterium]
MSRLSELPLAPLPKEEHLRPDRAGLRRRLALWMGLPAILAVVWALAGGGEMVSGTRALALVAGFALVAAALFFLSAHDLRAFTRANAAASTLVFEGHLAEACAAFEANARRFRAPALHPISVFNLADTELLRGDLPRALSLATAVAIHDSPMRSPLVASSAPSLVASCYALLGDLAAARAWMPEAERAAATTAVEVARVPEAIIACREGRFADVVSRYAERRRAIEATLAGEDLRTLRLLRAFAMAGLPSASEAERAEALAVGRPGAAGECDHLALAWPELRGFLERHQLAASRG